MIFDTHCHYNLAPLDTNISNKTNGNWFVHWQKAQTHGVKKSIVVGTDFFTSSRATQIAEADSNLFAAVGIHPDNYNHYKDLSEFTSDLDCDRDELKLIIGSKVVAIGETGLDYFRLDPSNQLTRQIQRLAFKMHLKLAIEYRLPVIIHVRDVETPETPTVNNAYWDALTILRDHYSLQQSDQRPFILHCVSGPLNYIREALELGAYIGVAGNVTYKNAHQIRKIVKLTPPDRILVETDAPFLPPQKFRGQTCEPWMINETVRYLKEKCDVDEKQLIENSTKIFN